MYFILFFRELVPKNHFIKVQENGSHVIHRPDPSQIELCQYQGNIRGIQNSWAAISTCSGIRGVVHDGNTLHYIEKSDTNLGDISGEHYVYKHEDLVTNHTCGYEGTPHDIADSISRMKSVNRVKRSPQLIRGPYNANRRSRFVELILVVDHRLYENMNKDLREVNQRCKDIANIINALYTPLNIFIALVGVVVWTELDEITLSTKGDTTLTNFLHYRREKLVKEHPNDNAQLLTKIQFDGGVVGKALKGPMCTYEFSGGVSMDHSSVVGLVATTVTHEMGHNFGMEHDTSSCECPDDRCIMAPSSSSTSPTHWSSCSLEYLAVAFEHGMDYCLKNIPERLFDSPVCGNGFVEPGEQCDCGLEDRCNNPCCNATTCMLYSNASCATGECCDLSTCHPKNAGTMCRSADHECDLPEYCTGESEYCPGDVFKMDGETCDYGKAFCYKGTCRSHSDQCRLLWGPSGKSSDFLCYRMNTKGSRHGNCGYNRLNQSYVKCYDENIYCGMLHCMHLNEKLEFGMESVSILSHSFINAGGSIIPCRTAIVDLGLNEIDPGLAPDGAKCADGKMCVGQKCLSVAALTAGTACKDNCNGNGVCNSLGHCHCNTGFAPPLCHHPGTGGSEDSGPASQPNARREVITAFYIVFLGVLPTLALITFFLYYIRKNTIFGKKPTRPPILEKKTNNDMRNTHHRGNGTTGAKVCRAPSASLEISGPLIVDHSRATLLPRQEANVSNSTGENVTSHLQSNLLGHFVGFSITPIQKEVPHHPSSHVSASSAHHSQDVTASGTLRRENGVIPGAATKNTPIRPAPKVPPTYHHTSSGHQTLNNHPVTTDHQQRPVISSPVLAATTSTTAKDLIDHKLSPSRPAPTIPPVEIIQPKITNHQHQNIPPLVHQQLQQQQPSLPQQQPNTTSQPSGDDKKNYPALTRIASFMRGQKPDIHNNKKEVKKKLDKELLRNIEISNPIPQKEIEIPLATLPAGDKATSSAVVSRAQSLRDTGVVKRAPIPTFGSMRVQNNKRPTSIPAAHRPTSPPPRPPSSVGLPGYQPNASASTTKPDNSYDDCLNLLTENNAPLAHIDEESPKQENIYAVIEENPQSISDYKVPNPVDPNSDSMGLLGEIVLEIEARNTESIYSASTLKRKKDNSVTDDDVGSTVTDISTDSKSNQTYMNTNSSNSSNSGYLSPIVNNQNKADLKMNSDQAVINKGPTVPEASAPYKPYSSSLHRNVGPFAASYNKTPTPEMKLKSEPTPTSAPKTINTPKSTNSSNTIQQLNRSKTPPSLQRHKTPPSLSIKKIDPVKKSLEQNKKFTTTPQTTAKPQQQQQQQINTNISNKQPDIVSSCTNDTNKAPDIVTTKQDKPKLKQLNKSQHQPLPTGPKPIISNNKPKTDFTNKINKPAVRSNSKVASLQQKFENQANQQQQQVPAIKSNLDSKNIDIKR
ncbi:hypothetical protein O3M35_012175 [Rhynocoris fuscipes]|uniref:Disintegrin and metalloproteinase domain-containing protein 12 n=1 Tax=Rhynocoris fuscipes TaxID=488301 RepID=A0AAW1CYW0_9HEMI